MYNFEIINDNEKFLKLEEEWDELLSQSYNDIIFLTHEWIYNWWMSFGNGIFELFLVTVTVKKENELIAILPLMKDKSNFWGITKILSMANYHTPKFDLIIKIDQQQIITKLIEFLQKEIGFFELVLNYIPKKSPTFHVFQNLKNSNRFYI